MLFVIPLTEIKMQDLFIMLEEINYKLFELIGIILFILFFQHKLEAGLLALGQLESSLDELLNWMDRTDSALSNQKPLTGDPKMAEIELAKHKVLQNDIHSHQPTVDSINQAARSFVSSADNRHAANAIRGKLDNLNGKWKNLLKKSDDRQRELEDILGQVREIILLYFIKI